MNEKQFLEASSHTHTRQQRPVREADVKSPACVRYVL